jgi:hypothetical protein
MKALVYIESSVISYHTARSSRDLITAARQAITQDWWDNHFHRYDNYVSVIVEQEIGSGDPRAAQRRIDLILSTPSLQLSDEAKYIAEGLLAAQLLPAGSVADAMHIGIAAVNGMDYLLTWHFKHINNAETKNRIVRFIENEGYICPVLCSPEELGGTA